MVGHLARGKPYPWREALPVDRSGAASVPCLFSGVASSEQSFTFASGMATRLSSRRRMFVLVEAIQTGRTRCVVDDVTWGSYVGLHGDGRASPRLFRAKRDGATSPYEWAVQALDASGPVLDLACGSAPLRRLIPDLLCIGMDSSWAELGVASRVAATPLILASSSDIPLSDKAVAAVVCSMALQVLQPLDRTLDEGRPRTSSGRHARRHRPGRQSSVVSRPGSLRTAVHRAARNSAQVSK